VLASTRDKDPHLDRRPEGARLRLGSDAIGLFACCLPDAADTTLPSRSEPSERAERTSSTSRTPFDTSSSTTAVFRSVVKPGRRAPRVVDLARVRSQVRLEKVPGSRPGSAEAREKVGSYRPVLVLLSETDRRESVIELADQRTRAMRLTHETRALEAAMRLSADPAIQHAAGQLRTLLRWKRLPVIHDAAPDAIPASPDDATSTPIPRTRVASGVEGPEIEVAGPGRP
jgi:hypothetical protein